MSVKIRMKRIGATKRPFYRIVVADSRRATNGRFIEELGFYNPISDPRMFRIDADKVKNWIANGAQPSKTCDRLFKEYKVYDSQGLVEDGCANQAKPKKHYEAEVIDPSEYAKVEEVEEVAEPAQEAESEPEAEAEAETETEEAEAE